MTAATHHPAATTAAGDAEIQAVVFNLGQESFALPIGVVREILDHREAFRMPNAPAWLRGLTDVRGEMVPMVDLRVRLGLSPADVTLATRVLVVEITIDSRALTLGLVVDRVFDVGTFGPDSIEPAPDIGVRWRSDYISGVIRREGGFVVLLDLAAVFNHAGDAEALVAMAAAA